MTQQELAALKALQELVRLGFTLTGTQQLELDRLRAKLSVTEMERADDPHTPFTDETLSPNLADDGDYLQQQKARDAAKAQAFVDKAWEKLEPLLEEVLITLAKQALGLK